MSSTAPGWYPDPYGRHESRYWDGGRWTEHVSDRGATAVDPTEWGAATSSEAATTTVPVSESAAAAEVPPEPDPEPEPPTTGGWEPTPPAPPEPPSYQPPEPPSYQPPGQNPPPVATPPAGWGAPPTNVPPPPPTWGGAAPGGAWSPTAARPAVDTRDRVPAIVGLVGAVVLLVAAFLPWFRVEVPDTDFSETVSGMDGGDGAIVLVLALAAGVFALLRILGKGPSALGIGVAIAGVLTALVGLINLGNNEPDNEFVAALTDVTTQVGLWLVILGGLAVTVAGVLVVLVGRSRRSAA